MHIKTLVEDRSNSSEFDIEHGLCLYIETSDQKILFDVGASDLFLKNSRKLGVNIADIDFLVISHGHYDHGGGLKIFMKENKKARIFIRQQAFEKHYSLRSNDVLNYIGLEEELKQNKQIIFTSDLFFVSKGIQLYSKVVQREPLSQLNSKLLTEYNGQIFEDNFVHEQNLIIEENGKTLLITGCAHNGIINILEHFRSIKGVMPDYVIGGFHLFSNCWGNEDSDVIDRIGRYLVETKTRFYTCHCTGIEPYKRLKTIIKDDIDYLSTGSEIVI